MTYVSGAFVALGVVLGAAVVSGCGSDDDGGSGGGTCHCEWGDSCDEYSLGCAFLECESDSGDVKAAGACPQNDVIGSCACPSEDLVTYYRSAVSDPAGECAFWCDEGVYEAR